MEPRHYYYYELQNDWNDKFVLRDRYTKYKQKNYFDTPEEATKHFKESEQIARAKYSCAIQKINEMKEYFGFSIGAWAYAHDDSGLEYGAQIEIEVNGYVFVFRQEC